MSATCAMSSDHGNAPLSVTSRSNRRYVAVIAIEVIPHVLTHAAHSYDSPCASRSPFVSAFRLGFFSAIGVTLGSRKFEDESSWLAFTERFVSCGRDGKDGSDRTMDGMGGGDVSGEGRGERRDWMEGKTNAVWSEKKSTRRVDRLRTVAPRGATPAATEATRDARDATRERRARARRR